MVEALNDWSTINFMYCNLICDCRELSKKFQAMKISHDGRDMNKTTDCMANFYRINETSIYVIRNIPNPPSYYFNFLTEDYVRLVN